MVDRNFRTRGGVDATQLEPGACDLVRQLEAKPTRQRSIEITPRRLAVTRGKRDSPPCADRDHCRPLVDARIDERVESRRRRLRRGEIRHCERGIDQEIERRDLGAAMVAEVLHPLLEVVTRAGCVAARERQRRDRHVDVPFRFDRGIEFRQELRSLFEPPLPDAQIGQPSARSRVKSGTRTHGDVEPGFELPLGVVPLTAGREHAPVVDAALRVEKRTAVARDEVVGDTTPVRHRARDRSRARTR